MGGSEPAELATAHPEPSAAREHAHFVTRPEPVVRRSATATRLR